MFKFHLHARKRLLMVQTIVLLRTIMTSTEFREKSIVQSSNHSTPSHTNACTHSSFFSFSNGFFKRQFLCKIYLNECSEQWNLATQIRPFPMLNPYPSYWFRKFFVRTQLNKRWITTILLAIGLLVLFARWLPKKERVMQEWDDLSFVIQIVSMRWWHMKNNQSKMHHGETTTMVVAVSGRSRLLVSVE